MSVARLERGAGFWWVVLAGALVAGEAVAVAASLEVRAVEAYTVPFALLMLLVGAWRGRAASSWLAYGPGLALAFGPSLLQEATPLRAFALGAAALAVTLAGAWRRLQAPALIGGATVAIVTVRELTPWIADLMGAVPRWVPMALGGLLLLVVGATYEARKRDVRRLRDAVARLR
ncbi:SCO7613 C-terminal domain-containing membrane protein [Nonomuraea dietziae]|uniref:SCO7613 C-terminal domain-containing membrane protein n=1 Tax=Nonomuraea dietziae TaxID=65515 RepID=UPI00360AFCBA